jgi:Spy/CpxP family protein refolding chaperone
MKPIYTKLSTSLVILLSTCALSLGEDAKPAPGAGGARPGRGGPPDAAGRAERLKTELGLTDEQTAKIKAIYEKDQAKNAEELKKLREDTTLSREEKGKKMREIFAATAEEIKPILTPEQQTKWKEAQEKRRAEGGRPGARGEGAKPGAKPEAKPEAK